MRILKKSVDKSGRGFVVVVPKDEEDLWHLYNIVSVGDGLKAGTFRKVQIESKTGSIKSIKKFIILKMRITNINYWGEENLEINITGRNLEQNRFLAVGQFHTIKVEFEHPITIYKNNWDKFHFEILKRAEQSATTSDIAAIVMEEGLAYLCFVKSTTTLVKAKLERNIPKKLAGGAHYDKAINQFFDQCLQAVIKFIEWDKIKCFIIASPGLVKDDFYNYIVRASEKLEGGGFMKSHKDKVVLAKASSGFKSSLHEVFSEPAVAAKIKDTSALKEVGVLESFFKTLKQDSDKVSYGQKYVFEANSHQCIQDLLISDGLFHTRKLAVRKSFIKLTEDVKAYGGNVYIFSSSHISGERLNDISGIAAILRYPLNMDYLDEQEEIESNTTEESEEEKLDESFMTDDLDEDFFKNMVDKEEEEEDDEAA